MELKHTFITGSEQTFKVTSEGSNVIFNYLSESTGKFEPYAIKDIGEQPTKQRLEEELKNYVRLLDKATNEWYEDRDKPWTNERMGRLLDFGF